MSFATYRREWFGTMLPDELSGIIVAFALIPEAIGFSIKQMCGTFVSERALAAIIERPVSSTRLQIQLF